MEIVKKTLSRKEWYTDAQRRFSCIAYKDGYFDGVMGLIEFIGLEEAEVLDTSNGRLCIADNGYFWLELIPRGRNWVLTAMFDDKERLFQCYYDVTRENDLGREIGVSCENGLSQRNGVSQENGLSQRIGVSCENGLLQRNGVSQENGLSQRIGVSYENGLPQEDEAAGGRDVVFYDMFLDVVVSGADKPVIVDADELAAALDEGVITRDEYDMAVKTGDSIVREHAVNAGEIARKLSEMLRVAKLLSMD